MARPRTFDESEVVDKAMLAFWRHGFQGTSIGDLEEATGITRISIYNTFKDKEGLFLKALSQYHQNARDFFNIEFEAGGLNSIIALFTNIAADKPDDAPQRFGCMLVNTALDVEAVGESAKAIINRCRNDMINSFRAALEKAKQEKQISSSSKILDDRAEFLVGSMWGCWTTARSQEDIRAARGIARTVVETVNSWKFQA